MTMKKCLALLVNRWPISPCNLYGLLSFGSTVAVFRDLHASLDSQGNFKAWRRRDLELVPGQLTIGGTWFSSGALRTYCR